MRYIPKYGECSIKDLWNEFVELDDKVVFSFFPDYPKGCLPDGNYFYPVKYFLIL